MRRRISFLGCLLLTLVGGWLIVLAQEPPKPQSATPAATSAAPQSDAQSPVVVQLVTDFASKQLVSELESFEAVTETQFTASGSQDVTLGERCTLWVRNAHVDGKHFFERYYQEKFVGRRASLEIAAAELAPGEHFIEPGHHRFVVEADGRLTSTDPDIQIEGRTVSLRMYRVSVLPVDARKTGPAEFRLVPASLGLLATDPDFKIDPQSLPDLKVTRNPHATADKNAKAAPLTDALSHSKRFLSLHVWLPANEVGQGFLLYPSWQTFRITPGGKLVVAAGAPSVPGIELLSNLREGEASAEPSSSAPRGSAGASPSPTNPQSTIRNPQSPNLQILIPYRPLGGKISSHTTMTAGVGAVQLAKKMNLGPTLEPLKFTAGHDKPDPDFFLPVDNDAAKLPNKFFVADNTTGDKEAIRLLATEWNSPVFERGSEAAISVRLLETANKITLPQPEVRLSYSPYRPASPAARDWRPLPVAVWKNSREAGELRFVVPDIAFQFVVFRVQVFNAGDANFVSPLTAEIPGCVVEKNQTGSASFVTVRGRNAFVAGEEITLQAVFRSRDQRPAGSRTVVLTDAEQREHKVTVADDGSPWCVATVRLPALQTHSLTPGRYSLTVRDLPSGVAAVPFEFDLVGADKPSLFHVVKPSKYTGPMNELVPSHLSEFKVPIDLERATDTLGALGYNRMDLMTYQSNHHLRGYTWREDLVELDPRLPPPEAVYTPTPREQLLNGCVRNQMQFADIWISYGDFHLPRMIEPYIQASERWMAREVQAMRHSPAFDGMILYDEMYQGAVVTLVEHHQKYFAAVRARLAEEKFGVTPAKISQAITRYVQRPPSQRDPAALQQFIAYQDWTQKSWADFVNRAVAVGKQIAPHSRYGTYHRTWLSPGTNDEIYHGYPPDLFQNLDIISHIHYADNSTSWVSTPMLASILKTGRNKTLYINMPLVHEVRTNWDGQYTRQMAFAVMAQGATGVSQWGLPHTFEDGPNTGTAVGTETTRHLNREILQPFGEIIQRTGEGYRKVGIVSTIGQHAMSEFKQLAAANQTEGIAVACWRLGYPATFLREEHLAASWNDFEVIFVPSVRFDGELAEPIVKRLKDAIAAGVRVVVEADSVLDLPGMTKLADWPLNSYFLGDNYFPTWADDELNKVYMASQPIVDYLRPKLLEWNVEPAARGEFQVGPGWRDGGAIDYLVMANFDDPPYSHTVRQQMAQPKVFSLQVPKHRGAVAYDLIHQQRLPVTPAADGRANEQTVNLDLRRVQGTFVAFTPEPVAKLQIEHRLDEHRLHIAGRLQGESTNTIDGVFPTRIVVRRAGQAAATYYRMLGGKLTAELTLPRGSQARDYEIEVREALSGQTTTFRITVTARGGELLVAVPTDRAEVPYPADLQRFVKTVASGEAPTKSIAVVPSPSIPGAAQVAAELVEQLKQKKLNARVVPEQAAYRRPIGDPKSEDPLGDGFHSWRAGQEIIGPALVVDEPVIVLGGRQGSGLVDALSYHGYLSVPPIGQPGLATPPSLQVATKGLHFAHDTLCVLANDAAGLRRGAQRLVEAFGGNVGESLRASPLVTQRDAEASRGTAAPPTESNGKTEITPAIAKMGTNEMVEKIQFDAAGNIYAITWGHGNNLYSLDPQGKPRFSRYLPEMGTNRLEVFADRLLSYTAAGARLYQLTLDNKPLSQARLNLDPGGVTGCDNYSLSLADYAWIPAKRWLLHNHGDEMRVIDEQYRILARWHGENYFDKDVADKVLQRRLHGYALSPDMTRIAQLESTKYFTKSGYKDEEVFDVHLVIRDLTGKLLHEHKDLDNGRQVVARLLWPAGSAGPVIHAPNNLVAGGHERWQFDAELKLLGKQAFDAGLLGLGGDRRLVGNGRHLLFYDAVDRIACRIGPFDVLPTFAALSPDGKHLATLTETGDCRVFATASGDQQARFDVPQMGKVLHFTPDNQHVLVGGYRGQINCFDLAGKPAWQRELAQLNTLVGTGPDTANQQAALKEATFPDFTDALWPTQKDEPGQLEKLVRLSANRLVNGNAEQDGGWQGGQVAFRAPGHEGARSLVVGAELVGQEVTGFLGRHATWVLEFHYRAAKEDAPTELVAGLMTDSQFSDSTAGRFSADGKWKFGRVAIKNGADCKKLLVGFSCSQGECLVDDVQFRQIRYPSVNHLLYEPLHAIQPIVLDNPLFSAKYDPAGNLRDQAPNRVMIPTLPGPLNLVESAFMQNGRLNETSSHWYIQPYNRESGGELEISLSLKEPRWVSTLALHFNQYQPENVTPHFDIVAVDPETGHDKVMASVRHNGQVFRIVKFTPIKTSLVKLALVNSIERIRTLSEIELYGPLSGREGVPGFIDADGQNTYMGDFSRVDKRVKTLAADYQTPIVKRGGHDEETQWAAPLSQPLIAEGRFYLARTYGRNSSHLLTEPAKDLSWSRAGGLGFTPFGALYGGLLLRCGNDGKLYCLNPDTGAELWTATLGKRLFGCPVAIGEDVFVTNDEQKLFQLDLASGTIMKEAEIPGLVFGSLTTDGKTLLFITDNGQLNAYDPVSFQSRWTLPIAPDTDSTPAIDGGVVYLADQQGRAVAVDAATGKPRWTTELKDEFARCPVVGTAHVVFGCRGGTLAVLNRADGKLLWSKDVKSRFEYEPLLVAVPGAASSSEQILFFRGGTAMLANLADGKETPWQTTTAARGRSPIVAPPFTLPHDPVVPLSFYKGHLIFIDRPSETGHNQFQVNQPWHPVGGAYTVLAPVLPPSEASK